MNIRRNSLINLAGSVVGLILFAAMTPLYYRVIGSERYGLLSVILAFMVFFSTFDFGMGASLAYRVAGEARKSLREQSAYLWTALVISMPVGLGIGVLLFGMMGGGFSHIFRLSETVETELMRSVVPLLAMGTATVLQSTIGGLYRGKEWFLASAILGALGIILSILLPVAAAIIVGPSLHNLIIANLAGRLATLIPSLLMAHYWLLGGEKVRVSRKAARNLLGYGSWTSLAGIVELTISSADRFIIGATAGPAAVPFYTIPFSVVSRSMLFPNSLMSAALPQMIARKDRSRLQSKSLDILLLLTPLFIAGISLSPEFMTLWMGASFATHSKLPLQILGLAFWIEAVSSVLYYQILADGQPKKNFMISLAIMPPYLSLLVLLTTEWGVIGASFAYLLKNILCMAGRMLAIGSAARMLSKLTVDAVLVSAMLAVAVFEQRDTVRLTLGGIILSLSLLIKLSTHRKLIVSYIKSLYYKITILGIDS